MKRPIWQFVIFALVAFQLPAQPALQYFTNQANIALQAEFGFGVTNIPVYCATNPAVGYSAALHYQLQAVANAYDATTPVTNPPSVFRPTFAWSSGTLFITGYSCVSNDSQAQINRGFKAITNSTISSNDNVWGVPWVIGAKGQIPAFNEYCYSSEIILSRDLLFVREMQANGLFATNRPPRYTNQFYMMAISNIFGAEAWNFYPTALTNGVTIIISNVVSITITNNYNFGTNLSFILATNGTIEEWPSFYDDTRGFNIPLLANTISLPYSYWSESMGEFVGLENGNPGYLQSDLQQIGWPVHFWALNITNNLMYALVDNATGNILDFVNLGPFGSSLDLNQVLSNNFSEPPGMWAVAPATDDSASPMSEGVLNQIQEGIQNDFLFLNSLLGRTPCYPGETFGDPSPATAFFIQSCSWSAANPLVHYTIDDLTNPEFAQSITTLSPSLIPSLSSSMSTTVCTLGKINPDYDSGTVRDDSFDFSEGLFRLGFEGAIDLPYQVWASTNLLDWNQIGTAEQAVPGSFQFEDSEATNYSQRYYQVRLP